MKQPKKCECLCASCDQTKALVNSAVFNEGHVTAFTNNTKIETGLFLLPLVSIDFEGMVEILVNPTASVDFEGIVETLTFFKME